MNLQQLNNKIHQASKSELISNLTAWKDAIKSALVAGESEAYYKNHTGRELYRKLHNFGLGSEITSIGDVHDNGFRPLTVTGIKSSTLIWTPSADYNSSVLKLWLDASDSSTITKDESNAVSQWNDKSGNINHAAQSTAANQPTLTNNGLNSKAVVTFDGTNDSLSVATLDIIQSYSIFVVAKADGTSSGARNKRDYLFDGIGTGQQRSLVALNRSGLVQMYAYQQSGGWANSNFPKPNGYFVLGAVFNTTNSSLSLNGTNVANLSVGTSSLTNGIRIGANTTANNDFLDGDIAEIIILDETSSLDTRQKVQGYLAHKWGLEGGLPNDHAWKSTPPTIS